MPPDRTRRSGEHRVEDDETPEQLESMSTIGAIGAEVRSIRRECKIQFKHLDDRFNTFGNRVDEIVDAVKTITSSLHVGMQHCATHDAMLKGHDNRIERMEHKEESDSMAQAVARRIPGGGESSPSVWHKLADNKSLPWAVAGLLGLLMVLSALTGRDAHSMVPRIPTASGSGTAPTSAPPPMNASAP